MFHQERHKDLEIRRLKDEFNKQMEDMRLQLKAKYKGKLQGIHDQVVRDADSKIKD